MEFLILIFLKLFKIFLCKRDFYFCVAERVETRPQLLLFPAESASRLRNVFVVSILHESSHSFRPRIGNFSFLTPTITSKQIQKLYQKLEVFPRVSPRGLKQAKEKMYNTTISTSCQHRYVSTGIPCTCHGSIEELPGAKWKSRGETRQLDMIIACKISRIYFSRKERPGQLTYICIKFKGNFSFGSGFKF